MQLQCKEKHIGDIETDGIYVIVTLVCVCIYIERVSMRLWWDNGIFKPYDNIHVYI